MHALNSTQKWRAKLKEKGVELRIVTNLGKTRMIEHLPIHRPSREVEYKIVMEEISGVLLNPQAT